MEENCSALCHLVKLFSRLLHKRLPMLLGLSTVSVRSFKSNAFWKLIHYLIIAFLKIQISFNRLLALLNSSYIYGTIVIVVPTLHLRENKKHSAVMSYANSLENTSTTSVESASQLKLYQAFIFPVPVFFAFILLVLFYIFYRRRRRVDWSSLRMRTSELHTTMVSDELSRCELGLKKEVREILPIIVFKESFSVKDTQYKQSSTPAIELFELLEAFVFLLIRCSVCLSDYQADDRLQQIPACGHTFHMDCVDHWLATHSTCPLCRQSLLTPAKASSEKPHTTAETSDRTSDEQDSDDTSRCSGTEFPKASQLSLKSGTIDGRVIQHTTQDESGHNVDGERQEGMMPCRENVIQ